MFRKNKVCCHSDPAAVKRGKNLKSMRSFASLRMTVGFFLLLCFQVSAQQICPLMKDAKPRGVKSLETFKHIAILQDGRIKPLDTYAQNILLQFSGKKSFNGQSAIHWLARLLFTPQSSSNEKIFLMNNPELPMALGIEPDEKRRYSFAQIQPKYEKLRKLAQRVDPIDKKSRTIVDEEIIRIEANIRLYAELAQSFSFAFPHADFSIQNSEVLRRLKLPEGQTQFSFLDIALKADSIKNVMDELHSKPESLWSEGQREVVGLVNNLYQWSSSMQDIHFQIIPNLNLQQETWMSPWDTINFQFQTNETREEISLLHDLVRTYEQGNQVEFNMAARTFSDSISNRAGKTVKKGLKKIPLELLYNRLNLLFTAKILYGFAFFLFLFSLFSDGRRFYRLGFALVFIGFLAHALALALRITILSRPPVTNLYETFIFVGFVSSLVGIIVELVNKKWLGLVVSSVCGFIFLTIAGKFSAEGDTMQMLVAVLNSNFWLGTHVLSITTGYAGVCVAGILGHVYILQTLARPKEKMLHETTYRNILGVLGFGLTMSFLGTNLGGIWADQSWGRFWGWDPKENGAMLIVLWCAIIFHAWIGKLIGPLGVAVASALGIIVVAWAWFGVNFLSVGLHSYGFTSGAATGLITYVVCEILFLAIAAPILNKKLK